MVANTVERSLMAKKLDRVILAIDSRETKDALKGYGFEMVMTSREHSSGTDRIAEVARDIKDANIIINIQGDEPLIDPKIIDLLVTKLENPNVEFATVISKNLNAGDILNPHVVKAFINEKEEEVIEFKRNVQDFEIGGVYRHIGLYGYKKEMLIKFTRLEQSKNEIKYKLEQLRAIDNIKINAVIKTCNFLSVDTQEDLEKIIKLMEPKSEIQSNGATHNEQ